MIKHTSPVKLKKSKSKPKISKSKSRQHSKAKLSKEKELKSCSQVSVGNKRKRQHTDALLQLPKANNIKRVKLSKPQNVTPDRGKKARSNRSKKPSNLTRSSRN